MKDYKHICDFSYCKTHQSCIYKNATAVLKNHACKAKVGHEENANILVCYQLGLDVSVYEGEYKKQDRCENTKCHSLAEVKFNGEINLCYKCVDTLRQWKTNYELGTIFKRKDKILKLFKVINEINESEKEMVRCSNIYCGTLFGITRHHLIPKPFRNNQTVEKIPLCEECHKRVHQLATNTELAKNYNTKQSVIDLLANDIKFRVNRVLNVNENIMSVA